MQLPLSVSFSYGYSQLKTTSVRMLHSLFNSLPLSYSFSIHRVSLVHYHEYRTLCGYNVSKGLSQSELHDPPCYLESAFIKPLLTILSKREFPLSTLALIHIKQTIKVFRHINFENLPNFNLTCEIVEIRSVLKGIEIDISCKACLNGDLVWESVTTLLSRNKATQTRSKRSGVTTNTDSVNQQEIAWGK